MEKIKVENFACVIVSDFDLRFQSCWCNIANKLFV